MSSWKVYIDDSADKNRDRYIVAGAAIALKQEWHSFFKKWNKILKSHPPIAYFRRSEMLAGTGEFAKIEEAARTEKANSFKKLISESGIAPMGTGMLIPAYEKVKISHPRASMFMAKDAFEWVLQHIMLQAVNAIRTIDESPTIHLICDTSNKNSRYRKLYEGFRWKNPVSALSIGKLEFSDDKKVAGLQVADMIASATNGVFRDYVECGTVNLDGFLVDGMYRISFANEQYLINVLDAQSGHSTT